MKPCRLQETELFLRILQSKNQNKFKTHTKGWLTRAHEDEMMEEDLDLLDEDGMHAYGNAFVGHGIR